MQFTKALQHTIGWKALNTILIFLINLLLVRILGVTASGHFFYSITLLSFITLIISWSMESGITYYGSNYLDNIPSITIFILPWLLVQALITWGVLYWIPVHVSRQLSWLYVISNLVIIYFSALYYATKSFVSINVIICVVNSIVLGGLVWVYTKYGSDEKKMFESVKERLAKNPSVSIHAIVEGMDSASFYFAKFVYFGGFLLQGLALAIVYFIKSRPKFTVTLFNPMLIKKMLIYSSVALISNIIFFLVTRIDYFFVEKYCSEIALSNYVQVSKLGQLLVLLPTIIAGVVFPYSSGVEDETYIVRLQALCRIIGLFFLSVVVVIVISGYWIFPWLFGYGFSAMYTAMLIYLPGFYFLSVVTLLAAYIAGRAMLIKNLLASAIALIFVIAGDILLIPLWGINAAAAVSSLSYFLCMLYLLWIFKHHFAVKPKDFFAIQMKDLHLLFSRMFQIRSNIQ